MPPPPVAAVTNGRRPEVRAVSLLVLALLGACTSITPVPSTGPITALHLITVPVALDLDRRPGPDGISLKIYANDSAHPKPIRIEAGTLEILMFDGTFAGRTNLPPVLRTFTFPADGLRVHQFTAGIGTGYEFSLPWGTNRPTHRALSVAARHTAPGGRVVTSRPSSVQVLEK